MLDVTSTLDDVLYPPIEPYDEGMLSVSQLHTIAWEKSGNPSGLPVIVIHGGPGGGGQPAAQALWRAVPSGGGSFHLRYGFDPQFRLPRLWL